MIREDQSMLEERSRLELTVGEIRRYISFLPDNEWGYRRALQIAWKRAGHCREMRSRTARIYNCAL